MHRRESPSAQTEISPLQTRAILALDGSRRDQSLGCECCSQRRPAGTARRTQRALRSARASRRASRGSPFLPTVAPPLPWPSFLSRLKRRRSSETRERSEVLRSRAAPLDVAYKLSAAHRHRRSLHLRRRNQRFVLFKCLLRLDATVTQVYDFQ